MTEFQREEDRVRILPLLLLACIAGCAESYDAGGDRSTHVERVLQDVSAMMEGMAQAHTESRIVLRGPENPYANPRSSK